MSTPQTPDIDGLKTKLKTTWNAGDYDRFSRYMEQGTRVFYERLEVPAGATLLDVACGSGQIAMWAARDGAHASGVDIAPNQIERAKARASAEGLEVRFLEGDAEELPFDDASFDIVTTLFGAMFAPRPELVARELVRVCRPGGKIVMGNWTPEGFIGQMFKVISKSIAPPGMPAPVLWGDENTVRERLGQGSSSLTMTRRHHTFTYPFPPADVVEFFRQYYGPSNGAFASLDEEGAGKLRSELEELWSSNNRGGADLTVVPAEFLEVIAIRK